MKVNEIGRFCFTASDDYDEYFHQKFGEMLLFESRKIVYCGIFEEEDKIRIMIHAGTDVSDKKNAGEIVVEVSKILGGGGPKFPGGFANFAQGGGKDKSKKDEAIKKAKSMVLG